MWLINNTSHLTLQILLNCNFIPTVGGLHTFSTLEGVSIQILYKHTVPPRSSNRFTKNAEILWGYGLDRSRPTKY